MKLNTLGIPFFDEMDRQIIDHKYVAKFRVENLVTEQHLIAENVSELKNVAPQKDLVTILPGSRIQEIKNCLPIFLRAAESIKKQRPQTEFVVSCLNEDQKKLAIEIQANENVGMEFQIEGGKTPELVHLAKCCIACSGSVSLELMHRGKTNRYLLSIVKAVFCHAETVFAYQVHHVGESVVVEINQTKWNGRL